MLRIHYPDGSVERFYYDGAGNRTKHVLPEQYDKDTDDGAGYTYAYDLAGRLIRELIPTGDGTEDAACRMTEYACDRNGNRIKETRYGGSYTEDGTLKETGEQDLTLTFIYDARNRLVRVEDGLGAKAAYRYDVRGNRISEEQVAINGEGDGGRTILKKNRYSYDKTGRLSEKREILDSGLDETGKEERHSFRQRMSATGRVCLRMTSTGT